MSNDKLNSSGDPDLWSVGPDFPELTMKEFDDVLEAIEAKLECMGTVNMIDSTDFVTVQDLYGDRTQMIYIENLSLGTETLVRELREILKQRHKLWRILVVREPRSSHAIWIYPDHVEIEVEGRIMEHLATEDVFEAWRRD